MFSRIYNLFVKEMICSLRDKKSRIILIVPPLVQILVFSFAMTQDVWNAKLAIWNQDTGMEWLNLVKNLEQTPIFEKITFLSSYQEIRPTLENQKTVAVLIIPENFSSELLKQTGGANLMLLLDGRRSNTASVLGGYFQQMIQHIMQRRLREVGIEENQLSGVNVVVRNWFNPNLIPQVSFVPGLIGLLTIIVGSILSGLTIAREREMGTFEQLLVSPLSSLEILIGKALSVLFLTTMTAFMLALIIIFLFGIPLKGSPWLLFCSTEAFLLSVIGIGLFISSLSVTQQQALLGCILFIPPSIMLSGFAIPIENMPHFFQTLTIADPLRWFLVVIKGLFLHGMTGDAVWENIKPLLVISLCTLSAATYMFSKRIE